VLIYCCGCNTKVEARLTDGGEIYAHRPDLKSLPFWKCDTCNNFVGCHHKTKNRTRPLGCIPTPEIKNARKHIHSILDPLWKSQNNSKRKRKQIYKKITEHIDDGYEFHTAQIRDLEKARKVYRYVQILAKEKTV
jgi:hypothetical protein